MKPPFFDIAALIGIGVSIGAVTGSIILVPPSAVASESGFPDVPAASNAPTDKSDDMQPCTELPAVEARLRANGLVNRGRLQALSLSTRPFVRGAPLFVQQSLTVYDHLHRTVVPPVRTPKSLLSDQRSAENSFEVPDGLEDGHYYAELLTAHSPDDHGNPLITAERIYFKTIEGQIEVMNTSDWISESDIGGVDEFELKDSDPNLEQMQ